MTRALMALAATGMIIAGPVRAECPTAMSDAVLTALGPAIASLEDETVYQVSGLRMFGRPVPHVLVQRDNGKVETVRYRLGAEVRAAGRPLAPDLVGRFRASYGGAGPCPLLSCFATPGGANGLGSLYSVELGDTELYFDEAWSGPGAAALMAQDEQAVYLSCEYITIE